MPRQHVDLNGMWRFGTEASRHEGLPEAGDRVVAVPQTYQSAFVDLFSHTGYTTYHKTGFVVPGSWRGDEVYLHFDAVNYWCEVWVNGTKVGDHEGGYTAFEFPVTDVVRHDRPNEIAVRVLTPAVDDDRFPFVQVPHGKQDWYGPCGGIWQSVYLERRSREWIETVRVTPDLSASAAVVDLRLHTLGSADALDVVITRESDDALCRPEKVIVERTLGAQASVSTVLPIPDAELWSPEHPNLYRLNVTVRRGSAVLDGTSVVFGMRTVERKDGQFLLNGEPYYLLGALDQDFYPFTGYTPPSRAFLDDQFRKAKAMGLNLLRCHIKIPHPMYLEAADRLGMLVWYDLPNWGVSSSSTLRHAGSAAAFQRGEALLSASVQADHNHPSVVIRSIINENWGPDLVNSVDDRRRLSLAMERFRKVDPSRLWVDNSACCDNFHVTTDIEDFHNYFAMPDHRAAFDRWLASFSSRPAWTFAPDTQNRAGTEVMVLSEFGNWGLPELETLFGAYGEPPDWVQCPIRQNVVGPGAPTHDPVVVDVAHVQEAFAATGVASVFGDFDVYAKASQRVQFQAVQYQIHRIRMQNEIQGYVITELTDLQWEANGMLDMARNPKSHFDRWDEVNAPDVVIPHVSSYTCYSDEMPTVEFWVSHYSTHNLSGGAVRWSVSVDGWSTPDTSAAGVSAEGPSTSGVSTGRTPRGEIQVVGCERATVQSVGSVQLLLDDVSAPTVATVRCELVSSRGEVVNHTSIVMGVYPRLDLSTVPTLIRCRDTGLARYLAASGARITDDTTAADLVISVGEPTPDELAVRERGAALLVVCVEPGAVRVGSLSFHVINRDGVLSGDWASNNNWFDPRVLRSLPTDGLMDFSCEGAAGELLIESNDEMTSHAGMVLGWAHSGGWYLASRQHSDGGITAVTTFPLASQYGTPTIDAILNDLVGLAATRKTK